jgi:NAD(P)-dependent dehydrogenase (short-subunit alcohol dehydrogenase family)
VVNDLGGTKDGAGADPQPARQVADEITAAGGVAIADASDISQPAGGQALIDVAIAEFGRVDVLVNNAGNIRWGGLPEVEVDNIEAHLAVHTKGSFNTVRAAWPHMLAQNYGRVVLTGSSGMFGLPDNLGYATAKAALIGMARSLTVSAGDRDIRVNVIAPNAWTRMADRSGDDDPPAVARMEPELVAAMAAFLAHEACPVSGEVYLAGAGRFARVFVAVTDGYVHPDGVAPTVDAIAANWSRINDETGYYVPTSLAEWARHYMSHRT